MGANVLAITLLMITVIGVVILDKSIRTASVMSLIWLFLLLIAHVYYQKEQLPEKGVAFIVASCIISLIASIISNQILIVNRLNNNLLTSSARITNNCNILAFAAIVGFLYMYAKAYYNGVSIAGFGSVAGSTYHADLEGNLLDKLVNAYCFSFIAVDGFAFFYQKNRDYNGIRSNSRYSTRIIPVFVLQLLIATISSQKSPIIWSAIFWVAGIVTGIETFVNRNNQRQIVGRFLKNNAKTLCILAVGFVSAMFLLFFVRHKGSLSSTIDTFMLYGFCEVPVFSIWFSNISTDSLQHSMGGQTIYGIARLFGLADNLSINWPLDYNAIMLDAPSNIYTAFRGLIEDFGINGSIIFWCVLGILVGQAEKETERSLIKMSLVNMSVVFVLFTFLISAWHYATVFIACVMFYFDLIFINYVDNDFVPDRSKWLAKNK